MQSGHGGAPIWKRTFLLGVIQHYRRPKAKLTTRYVCLARLGDGGCKYRTPLQKWHGVYNKSILNGKVVVSGDNDEFQLTKVELFRSLRLKYAITYASAQGITIDGLMALHNTDHCYFSWKMLYVGTSRSTASNKFVVYWTCSDRVEPNRYVQGGGEWTQGESTFFVSEVDWVTERRGCRSVIHIATGLICFKIALKVYIHWIYHM